MHIKIDKQHFANNYLANPHLDLNTHIDGDLLSSRQHLVSLYDFSDIALSTPISTELFHSLAINHRELSDNSQEEWASNSTLYDLNGKEVCSMSSIIEGNKKSSKAELQNFMQSVEVYKQDNGLSSYMLTLTLRGTELKRGHTQMPFFDHANMINNQVAMLRYFMKMIYSDRLTKYNMGEWMWMRMLELTKVGNIHMHEALFFDRSILVKYIRLIILKMEQLPFVGRSHMVIGEDDWSIVYRAFPEAVYLGEGEWVLEPGLTFFDKSHPDAGIGFIIKVLDSHSKHTKSNKSSATRYIMKYLLKTKEKEATAHRSVFSFFNIIPFSFKRGVLFSLVKFRKLKKEFTNEGLINKKNSNHSLYFLKKEEKNDRLKLQEAYIYNGAKLPMLLPIPNRKLISIFEVANVFLDNLRPMSWIEIDDEFSIPWYFKYIELNSIQVKYSDNKSISFESKISLFPKYVVKLNE